MAIADHQPLIVWLDDVGAEDVALVGGKIASLGEMYRALRPRGVRIPNAFAITARAYRAFLEHAQLTEKIPDLLAGLDPNDVADLQRRSRRVRNLILGANLPDELVIAVCEAYRKLCKEYSEDTDVAVRSSATAEDLPSASFAGQQDTYLNIRGEPAVLEALQRCFASLFNDRAMAYREHHGFDHFAVSISVGVQKMVRADLASSGVAFTIDTESGFKDVVFITGTYGLGELLVQGAVTPDEFYVFKPTLQRGYASIIEKKLGSKKVKLVYGSKDNESPTKVIKVPADDRKRPVLTDSEILDLARWGVAIEEHYSRKFGRFTPMDIEWAKDGELDQLFIVQARPETVHSRRSDAVLEIYHLKQPGTTLVSGLAVGSKIGAGKVHILDDATQMAEFKDGEVLVADMTDPDWEPIMKKAAAIVTNKGGRTCHAAIVSRELGIPAVVGTTNGLETLITGQDVTVSCAEGERGKVYREILEFEIERIDLEHLPQPRTMMMMNVGNPEKAFDYSHIPNRGVGLAREEFIIASSIKVHPLALLQYEAVIDRDLRDKIDELTFGYDDKAQFYVDRLAEGVAKIAAAYYPHDVIVRFSDFKSNEYANLLGGELFEPKEENPMIGWRGASRYYAPKFKAAFGLECKAIRRVREEMGLSNVKVMVPFCRTPEEGQKVLEVMAENGLRRGEPAHAPLHVYVMAELPSNIQLASDFADLFDGFSIGSNDLTQLTLGLDRDSSLVAHLYNERSPAVKQQVKHLIEVAHQKGRKVGICGQAPSDFPEFTRFLVECGIDSISLNPDSVMKGWLTVLEVEAELGVIKFDPKMFGAHLRKLTTSSTPPAASPAESRTPESPQRH